MTEPAAETRANEMIFRRGGTAERKGVAVVTGGSAGVGRATVRAFAAAGYDVGILARGREGLEAAADEVQRAGRAACAIPTDVADYERVAAAARAIDGALRGIDIWVNNAMTTIFAPFVEIDPAAFERATRVTYLGSVWGTRAALDVMRPRGRGTIVQVGSALAYRSIPLQSPYCGAKSAIRGFLDSLRSELIHDDLAIDLTMVQLPGLNTPQFQWCETRLPNHPQPVPPVYQPEVAADAILWAAEHPQREVWVGASAWKAIVGQKVIPGLLDRYLARKAWEGQQTDEPVEPGRPSNLFEPADGDYGARGVFGREARSVSPQMELSKRRRLLGGALLAAAAAYAAGMLLSD